MFFDQKKRSKFLKEAFLLLLLLSVANFQKGKKTFQTDRKRKLFLENFFQIEENISDPSVMKNIFAQKILFQTEEKTHRKYRQTILK